MTYALILVGLFIVDGDTQVGRHTLQKDMSFTACKAEQEASPIAAGAGAIGTIICEERNS